MADFTLATVDRTKEGLALERTVGSTLKVTAAEPVRLRIQDDIGRRRPDAAIEATVEAPTRSGAKKTTLRERRGLDVAGDLTFYLIGFPPGRHFVSFEVAVDEATDGGLVKQRAVRGGVTVLAE